jgi:deoxyribose-phosphate aldolase
MEAALFGPVAAARRLARAIDHTVLKAEATETEIRRLCHEAAEYEFAAVCVNPCWVPLAAKLLAGQPVAVAAVCGFPLGANTSAVKAAEAAQIVEDGGREVDMVINLGLLRSGEYGAVERDIAAVRRVLPRGVLLKAILETAALTAEQKSIAAQMALAGGADFLKTSTGFHAAGGATLDDVRLLHSLAAGRALVKASGGIRDTKTALAMLDAGASRLGTSAGVALMAGLAQPAPAASR